MQLPQFLSLLTAATAVCAYQSVLNASEGRGDTSYKTLSLKRGPRTTRVLSARPTSDVSRTMHESDLISGLSGWEFVTEILLGEQLFDVSIDTGSADTWLIAPNFTCLDTRSGQNISQSACQFGAGYNTSADSDFRKIPDEHFFIKYESGEFLLGDVGFTTVTLAGVKVPQQLVAVINSASWTSGDGFSSGLLGLGLPFATSLYPGTDHSDDNKNTKFHYSPIMDSIFRDNLVESAYFALAISRDESNSTYGGQMTIGSLPNGTDPRVNATTTVLVSAPFQYTPDSLVQLGRYSIHVDEVFYGNKGGNNSAHYTIDSGTSVNLIPNADADVFNNLVTGRHDGRAFVGYCNKTMPNFSVVIDGTEFPIHPLDLLIPYPNHPGICQSAILRAEDGENILGDPFLRSILAVFDWGNRQMSFASRVHYQS